MAALIQTSRILQRNSTTVWNIARKNFGFSAPVMAKLDKNADPIQRLFLDKLNSYKQKSKDGKLVDVTPEMEANIERETGQIKKRFGGGNLEEFPKFTFADK